MLKIQTIARLGQDATVNTVNGKTVINFSAAHSEKYKNNDGQEVNKTTWISCAYWTDKINVSNYLKKGTLVFLEGKPEAKTYKNNNDQILPQLHVRISFMQLLSSKSDSSDLNSQSNLSDENPF